VGDAQSAYAQAASEHALAKANLDRAEKLYADQIIPQKNVLQARADFEKAKAVLRAATDKRQALGINGNTSSSTGSSVFSVSAPFSGTIIEKKAVLGELAQSDKPLFSVADLSKRVGFRVIPGLSERVIYRELFPKGLTLLDLKALGQEAGLAHVAARQELREMISGLALSQWPQHQAVAR
jgi:hypothetical protein